MLYECHPCNIIRSYARLSPTHTYTLTHTNSLSFSLSLSRTGAVPRGVDLMRALRQEKVHSRQREMEEYRLRRRMSDSSVSITNSTEQHTKFCCSLLTPKLTDIATYSLTTLN